MLALLWTHSTIHFLKKVYSYLVIIRRLIHYRQLF